MTFQLFSDKSKEDQIIALLEGMKKAGLIDFFKKEETSSEEDDAQEISPETKKLLDDMLEDGERDIKEGNLMTSEEVLEETKKWFKNNRT